MNSNEISECINAYYKDRSAIYAHVITFTRIRIWKVATGSGAIKWIWC